MISLYNVHPYFSLKNLGKKGTHYTQQNMVVRKALSHLDSVLAHYTDGMMLIVLGE